MHCKGIKSLPWKPVTASIDVAIQVIKDLMLRYGSVLLQAAHRSLSLSLHGSHLTLCDREPHHLRQQFWSQHLGDRDSSDSYSLCKVCTPFSRYELSAGCISAKPITASARGYRKKGVEIRCWQGNVSHIDIMKQEVCRERHVLIWLGG